MNEESGSWSSLYVAYRGLSKDRQKVGAKGELKFSGGHYRRTKREGRQAYYTGFPSGVFCNDCMIKRMEPEEKILEKIQARSKKLLNPAKATAKYCDRCAFMMQQEGFNGVPNEAAYYVGDLVAWRNKKVGGRIHFDNVCKSCFKLIANDIWKWVWSDLLYEWMEKLDRGGFRDKFELVADEALKPEGIDPTDFDALIARCDEVIAKLEATGESWARPPIAEVKAHKEKLLEEKQAFEREQHKKELANQLDSMLSSGKYEEALPVAKELFELEPNTYEHLLYRVYNMLGQHEEVPDMKPKEYDGYAEVAAEIVVKYAKTGKYKEAINLAKKFLKKQGTERAWVAYLEATKELKPKALPKEKKAALKAFPDSELIKNT
ncbi:MAG: hypothetical protein ACTSU5_21540 [Promethearchaeota archaeon]